MIYSQITVAGETKVWFFRRSKRAKELDRIDAQTIAIQEETKRKAEKAAEEIKKVNELFKDRPDDIAALIFYSTGGYRREK
jgi:hypothetical protein